MLKALSKLFLLPGTMVIQQLGISLEEDGGIFRSMVNMLFWGAIFTPIVLALVLAGM